VIGGDEMHHLADEKRAVGERRGDGLDGPVRKRRPGEGQEDGEKHHFFRAAFGFLAASGPLAFGCSAAAE